MNYFNFLSVFIFTCYCITGQAQSGSFAQYNLTPLLTNPALTGSTQAKTRILASNRNEWSGVLGVESYKTNTLSADGRLNISETGYIGWGASGYRSSAGDLDYTLSQGLLSFAYGKLLHKNGDKSHFLTLGTQAGVASTKVDISQGRWPIQHDGNGAWDPNAPVPVDIDVEMINNQKSYFDLNVGLLWTSTLGHHANFHIGMSAAHINKPNVSFLVDGTANLATFSILHAGAEVPLSNSWSLLPQIIYQSSNQYKQARPGLHARKYLKGDNPQQFVQGGISYQNDSLGSGTLSSDIVIINASVLIKGIVLGASVQNAYANSTKVVTNFEFSVGYLIGQEASSNTPIIW